VSGVLAILAAASYGAANSAWALDLVDTSIVSPGVRTVSATFATDGSTSAVGAGSSLDWFLPVTAGIGSAWSVRVTNIDGVATTYGGATMGTWQAMSSAKSFSFSNATSGSEGTGSASVEFSPDGGTSIVAAGLITWDVGYIS
jgi:hypothetical protein